MKELVQLNPDQKEVVERRSKDAFFAIKQLNKWIQDEALTTEMRESLPNLINYHLNDIKQAIGFSGEETDRSKEMTKAFNKGREERINELEKMVEEQNSLLSIKQQLKSISDKINDWWKEDGFNYIKDISYSENGIIKITFGFMLESFSLNYSDTPHSDRTAKKDKIQSFIDQGFTFAKNKHSNDKELIDCDTNRELLKNLIKNTFPSSKIIKFDSHLYMQEGPDENKFILRYFDVYIYDYEDIECIKKQSQ